ncbi:MAG: thioredoxin family protein [Candidatus Aureabacteria bacterium]|nr:thioredoxin family protein [Candidatus Auribacterota bacterium]
MKKIILIFFIVSLCLYPAFSGEEIEVDAFLQREGHVLQIRFRVPEGIHVYADSIDVAALSPAEAKLELKEFPEPDAETGDEKAFYHNFQIFYYVRGIEKAEKLTVSVSYQGCSGSVCFLPQSRTIELKVPEDIQNASRDSAMQGSAQQYTSRWLKWAKDYTVTKRMTGFMSADDFLKELRSTQDTASFADKSLWSIMLLVFIGGFALNLTPCVLPLIPVNLAIIGAGSKARSCKQGFLTGGLYGLGMAFSYGALGVFAVLSGSTLGFLNASPWFNAVICLIFIILSLGMFGFFDIDLSRFRPAAGLKRKGGSLFVPFFMGSVIALLAGSCIAPVMLSVLLFSSQMYAKGHILGLFLPFFLGTGMGLPWPLAGAGLSFLPRPGKWMVYVRNGFGLFIVLLAFYYGYLAFHQFQQTTGEKHVRPEKTEDFSKDQEWMTDLEAAFIKAHKENRPVFIDFWASWCKSCYSLDKRTLKDMEVRKALDHFVRVKFQAENPSDPLTWEVLNYFGVRGLPTMVVCEKK